MRQQPLDLVRSGVEELGAVEVSRLAPVAAILTHRQRCTAASSPTGASRSYSTTRGTPRNVRRARKLEFLFDPFYENEDRDPNRGFRH